MQDFHLLSLLDLKTVTFQANPFLVLLTVLFLHSDTSFFFPAHMHFLLSKISCKLLISLPDSLRLDHGICENVKSIMMTSRTELHDLEHGHYEKTKVITGNADRSLGDDYKVSNISLLGIYIRTYR
jgi:hypothetical protein